MTRAELLQQAKGYILANAQVAENIRTGKQSQHRVRMRVQPTYIIPDQTEPTVWRAVIEEGTKLTSMNIRAPWYPGQLLWLREPGRVGSVWVDMNDPTTLRINVEYLAKGIERALVLPDRFARPRLSSWVKRGQGIPNGIFREAARTFPRVTRVWPEQIQKTSIEDMIAEGLVSYLREHDACCDLRDKYHALMNSLYPGIVEANKWLWCCEFENVEAS